MLVDFAILIAIGKITMLCVVEFTTVIVIGKITTLLSVDLLFTRQVFTTTKLSTKACARRTQR